MKNIQVVDGAINCSYEVFTIGEEDFAMLFPLPEQDIEFSEDFFSRAGKRATGIWKRLWRVRANKKTVSGIHGTLFCGLQEKKRFYPTKRESEMTTSLE